MVHLVINLKIINYVSLLFNLLFDTKYIDNYILLSIAAVRYECYLHFNSIFVLTNKLSPKASELQIQKETKSSNKFQKQN